MSYPSNVVVARIQGLPLMWSLQLNPCSLEVNSVANGIREGGIQGGIHPTLPDGMSSASQTVIKRVVSSNNKRRIPL